MQEPFLLFYYLKNLWLYSFYKNMFPCKDLLLSLDYFAQGKQGTFLMGQHWLHEADQP